LFPAAGTIRAGSTFFIIGKPREEGRLMPDLLHVLHNAPRSDQLTMLAAATVSIFLIVAGVVL
jgi:hypothetical protein